MEADNVCVRPASGRSREQEQELKRMEAAAEELKRVEAAAEATVKPLRLEKFHKMTCPPKKALISNPARRVVAMRVHTCDLVFHQHDRAGGEEPRVSERYEGPRMALAAKGPWVPKDERSGGRFEKLPVLSREDRYTKYSKGNAMVHPSSLPGPCQTLCASRSSSGPASD
jgi:hypothetical protein